MKKLPLSKKYFTLLVSIGVIIAAYVFPSFVSQKELQEAIETFDKAIQPSPSSSVTKDVLPLGLYRVSRVVDGDTIVLEREGRKETVRLLGVDTPEVVAPRQPVECFGKEASAFLSELVEGKRMSIEVDPSQSTYDRYGRLLAYVYLEDGTQVNRLLLREGYAFEYTYTTPYKYQEEFQELEAQARENERGLWSSSECNGSREL